MSKKGVSLPVNVLVVLAIAIVVLLGVIAFFTGSLTPTKTAMRQQQSLRTCCTPYMQAGGCNNDQIKASNFVCGQDKQGNDVTLDSLTPTGVSADEACGC